MTSYAAVPFCYRPGATAAQTGFTATRADATTCARYRDSAGLWQTAAANVLRDAHYHYDGSSSVRTTLREGAATNLLTYGRDLTNAAWTATNVTVAATTGADGVASSGSRLTATGANGTVIRAAALVHGSAAYAGSLLIKRITGTGNIDLTLDNGTGWTTITSTAQYLQVYLTQTLANSQFGIRLVTSGDVVDVDFVQEQTGAVPSSPIGTAAAAVTRAADLWSFPWSRNPEAGTWYMDWYDLGAPTGAFMLVTANAAASSPRFNIEKAGGGGYRAGYVQNVGGTNFAVSVCATAPTFGQRQEFIASLSAAGQPQAYSSINGGATQTGANSGGPFALPAAWSGTVLTIGGFTGASFNLAIRSIAYVPGPETSMASMRVLAVDAPIAPWILTITDTFDAAAVEAGIAWFGQPRQTVIDTGTNTLLAAVATPGAGQCARMFDLRVSFSAAPVTGTVVVRDGLTRIWQSEFSATGPFEYEFDFSKKPLRSSRGNDLSVTVDPAGASVVQTVAWSGDLVRAP